MKKKSYLTVTDQFCGAGGSSLGAVAAGVELRLALNHWKLAIDTHSRNFPKAEHDCVDVSACNPLKFPSTDILITSPECFPAGTLILTTAGLTPIEDVQAGDLVLTHKGRFSPVTSVMRTEKPTVIVSGQGHRGLETTAEHPFYARRQFQQKGRRMLTEPVWTSAHNLTDATHRWASPVFVPELPIPPVMGGNGRSMEFSPAFWWMVGRWLGDGTVRLREGASSEVTICCGKHKVAQMEALHFAPKQGAHARHAELHWRKREIRTAYLFESAHDSIARWLVEHFGRRARGKMLPSWALAMPRDWREALLEGYVSADGHCSERTTSVSSVSKRLALGIRMLVTTLGYHPSFGCYRHKGGFVEGRPFAAYDLWGVRWESNKSQRTGINDGCHSWTLVRNVVESGRSTTVYNLSVEGDESYVADGIIAHNCTAHSLSSGKRKQQQSDLWGNPPDPAAERSRMTMFSVADYAEAHKYEAIIVENVVDARKWVMWPAWLHAMDLLGYNHKCVYLNSMFAHPAPQSRDRMYVVFWRKGNKAPNLDIHPAAWCARCEKDVAAVQTWKNGRTAGRYRDQYIYSCPHCADQVQPYYYAAASAIDWALPIERIGDRQKPLKEKTLARIRAGLQKFGRQALGVELGFTHATNNRAFPLDGPMRTQTTRQTMGLVMPPMLVGNYSPGWVRPVTEPTGTVTTQDHHALLIPYYSTGAASGTDDPLPTVTTRDRFALAIPPFILGYYTRPSGQGAAISGVDEPMPTQSTQPRHYLVQPGDIPAVEDCGFRMLQPHEIQAAMAFPADYKVLGNKREQVKQLGNAVTPPAMAILMQRIVETFN